MTDQTSTGALTSIRGRVFIVTGATSGLGLATAQLFLAEGAGVIAIGRSGPSHGLAGFSQVRFLTADVTREDDALRVCETALETFGHLHGLINCAGIATGELVVGRERIHRLDTFAQVVQTNLVGTFNMIRFAARTMSGESRGDDGERGVIVNTASVAAFDGQIGQAAYAASKAGIVGMTLPLAREMAQHGIRVVTIAPGVFDTPMVQAFPDKVRARLTEGIPFPSRFGRPEEFAAAVKHVCENRMINGETIRLDAALRMGAR